MLFYLNRCNKNYAKYKWYKNDTNNKKQNYWLFK